MPKIQRHFHRTPIPIPSNASLEPNQADQTTWTQWSAVWTVGWSTATLHICADCCVRIARSQSQKGLSGSVSGSFFFATHSSAALFNWTSILWYCVSFYIITAYIVTVSSLDVSPVVCHPTVRFHSDSLLVFVCLFYLMLSLLGMGTLPRQAPVILLTQ